MAAFSQYKVAAFLIEQLRIRMCCLFAQQTTRTTGGVCDCDLLNFECEAAKVQSNPLFNCLNI